MTQKVCNICTKFVLSHSYNIQCSSCKSFTHIRCLVSGCRNDIYDQRDWICSLCINSVFPFNHYDDDVDFMNVISENWTVQMTPTLQELNDIVFTPCEFNDDELTNHPLFNIDPDYQYFNDISNGTYANCNYFLEDSFFKKVSHLPLENNYFSIMHLNIRSIPRHLNEFTLFLETIKFSFSVIGISETWFNESTVDVYNIDGYQSVHKYRQDRVGGGVSIFIKDGIQYMQRKDIDAPMNIMESVFIEIEKNQTTHDKNVIVGVVYRPPGTDVNLFTEHFSSILSLIHKENKLVYILGDFNINLLNTDVHLASREFLDLLFSLSFRPLITKPTRVKSNSATLIDNIFVNHSSQSLDSFQGIFYTDISDHFPIFHIDLSSIKDKPLGSVKRRIYSQRCIERFKENLGNTDWSTLLSCNDAQQSYSMFHNHFLQVYDKSFPLKTFKNNYKNRKIWLTEGLKNSIKRKNRLYNIMLKQPTLNNEHNYKLYKRVLNRSLRLAEKEFYDKIFENNKNNLIKSWQIIKNIINKNKGIQLPTNFKINNQLVNDKNYIAESFNKFYVNIGSTLAQDIPACRGNPLDYIVNANVNSIYLNPVQDTEVINIIKELKASSPGWDDISPKIVKATYDKFIIPLTRVLNLSILNGVCPNEVKIAKVIPLYKNGDSMLINNYRPVSILPFFSKILEKLMYNRLISFINTHKVLSKYQFGFRKGHSTSYALVTLVDKIATALDQGDSVLGIFLDLSKAFDTVNHDILLMKLNNYGFRGICLDWLASYLRNRKQFVTYDNFKSALGNISCGVPQGSILGPLLFLVYINDLTNVSDKLFSILYADDTNLFIQGKDINKLISVMNEELHKILKWLNINRLSLNINKTHFMVFKSQKSNVNYDALYINNMIINKVEKTKFLGVIIDAKLNWTHHITYVKGKLSRGIGIICKARKVLKKETLIKLYYSFFYPFLAYCIEVWGNTFHNYIESLFKLQKKALRLITFSKWTAHTAELFKNLEILTLPKLYIYHIQIFMFKFHNHKLPCLFNNFFTRNHDVHSHFTRQANSFHVPVARTNLLYRSVRFKGVRIFNIFVDRFSTDCSISEYKNNIKSFLLLNEIGVNT